MGASSVPLVQGMTWHVSDCRIFFPALGTRSYPSTRCHCRAFSLSVRNSAVSNGMSCSHRPLPLCKGMTGHVRINTRHAAVVAGFASLVYHSATLGLCAASDAVHRLYRPYPSSLPFLVLPASFSHYSSCGHSAGIHKPVVLGYLLDAERTSSLAAPTLFASMISRLSLVVVK